MAEDLENLLATAFAPVGVTPFHVEVTVTCGSCGVAVDRRYPVVEADVTWLLDYHVEKPCQCGATRADGRTLTATVTEVDPAERGYGYCLRCRQIWEIAALEPWLTGLRCRTCAAVAKDAGQDEFGDFILPEGWNVQLAGVEQDLDRGEFCAVASAVVQLHCVGDMDLVPRASKVSERRFRTAFGDNRKILKTLADNSVDSVVTDPPYDLISTGARRGSGRSNDSADSPFGRHGSRGGGFMGLAWDATGIAFDPDLWREVLRVLKPGGHVLAFGGTRTYHRMVCAMEDAGFEIRDCLVWLHGQGMPKSENVSKRLDRMAGAERDVIAEGAPVKRMIPGADQNATGSWIKDNGRVFVPTETAPATEEAQQWDGWGSNIKPCWEPIVLGRKPIEGTIAANVLAYGTGGLNIDASRIRRASDDVPGWHETGAKGSEGYQGSDTFKIHDMTPEEIQARCGKKGRWPANALLQHSENCVLVGQRRVKGCPAIVTQGGQDGGGFDVGVDVTRVRRSEFAGYGDEDGLEGIDEWACVSGCPVRCLDDQSGNRPGCRKSSKVKGSSIYRPGQEGYVQQGPIYPDQGGASRFLYQAKPSKSERERGLLGVVPCHKCGGLKTTTHVDEKTGNTVKCLRNNHNTLKSLGLMKWLVRLVTPPGGVCLDMFAGSGTTGVAALEQGFQFLGIEEFRRYYIIMRARLSYTEKEMSS